MRHFTSYIDVLRKQWMHLYGEREPVTVQTYNRHMEMLKQIVPPERLMFFSVKDGWEPLCKAIGKEVPNVPFPNLNDGKAIDALAEKMVKKGLARWALILITIGVGVVSLLMMRDAS
jgi:hypothetical protein